MNGSPPVRQRLQTRLMTVFAAFTLAVSALFGLLAMAFVYSVEDRFIERMLEQEAAHQRDHHARHGAYPPPRQAGVTLHLGPATMPAEVAAVLADEPGRREMAGAGGRHYHLQALGAAGAPPWLLAEVGDQLVVRPMSRELLTWLVGWAALVVALALLVAAALARRTAAPLAALAAEVTRAAPEQLPRELAGAARDDEVGALARSFGLLLARTRAFIGREQAFTRDASHELRTPLAVLRSGLERLTAAPDTPRALRGELAALHAATTLMEQTVNTLLLLAREGSADVPAAPPTPVLPLIEQWVLAHAGWIERQPLALQLELQRGDRLALPPAVLQLVLASLLGNAFAHGAPGGSVRVCMEGGALRITNPGPALPPGAGSDGVKGEASAGFGFGLAIVRRLLEQHGARLEIEHHGGQTQARVVTATAPR